MHIPSRKTSISLGSLNALISISDNPSKSVTPAKYAVTLRDTVPTDFGLSSSTMAQPLVSTSSSSEMGQPGIKFILISGQFPSPSAIARDDDMNACGPTTWLNSPTPVSKYVVKADSSWSSGIRGMYGAADAL